METGSATTQDSGNAARSWSIKGSLLGMGLDMVVSDDTSELDSFNAQYQYFT